MISTNVRGTTHADSLALFVLNIDIFLTNLIKSEFDMIFWRINDIQLKLYNLFGSERSRAGLWNGVWISKNGPVVWEITGWAIGPLRGAS